MEVLSHKRRTDLDERIEHARQFGVAWSDPSGAFYLFGGAGFDGQGSYQVLNDQWQISTGRK